MKMPLLLPPLIHLRLGARCGQAQAPVLYPERVV